MFDNHLFRASGVGYLMVNPKDKKEELSESTKTHLLDIYISETYGRRKVLSSPAMLKGNMVEEDSITLVTQQTGDLLLKNKKQLSNEFIKGSPDIVTADTVIDTKSSWDLYTFIKADGTDKMYYWQLQSYMWLTGKEKAKLAYCLVNSPAQQIYQEKRRAMYSLGLVDMEGTEEFDEMERQVELNMTFDDIPPEKRIKMFDFEYNPKDIELLKQRITNARLYLNQLAERGI